MANRYFKATGATQNWTATNTAIWSATDGGAGGASVPTASDDVFFTSLSRNSSYTCSITATANCNNITVSNPSTGVATLTHNSTLNVYGNITYASGVSTGTGVQAINLLKASGTCLIDTNGVKFNAAINMNKAGTTFQLVSDFKVRSLQITAGIWAHNNKKVTITNAITGVNSFYDLEFSDPYQTGGETTFNTSLTVSNNFTVKGNTTTRVSLSSAFLGLQLTITAANNVGWEYANLTRIIGAGTANWNISAITGLSGDCGGNTNITFTAPVTQYWYRNTGNFSDNTKWFSATNGGGTAGRRPLPQDNCIFDENSFSINDQAVTTNYRDLCHDFDCRNVTNTPNFNNTMPPFVYGSMWFGTVKLPFGANLSLCGDHNEEYLPPATHSGQLTIIKPRYATVKLVGNFTLIGTSSFAMFSGAFDANDYNVNISRSTIGISSTFSDLYMGNGTWTFNNPLYECFNVQNNARSNIYAEGSTVIVNGSPVIGNVTFCSGAKTFNNVILNFRRTNNFVEFLFGAFNCTFNSVTIHPECRIGFVGSTTQTANTWNVMRGARLYRASGTTPYVLAKTGVGTVDMSYMNISNMTGSPVAKWNAVNSTDVTGNTNITFTKDDRDYQRFLS
jgi:hypothetical protein